MYFFKKIKYLKVNLITGKEKYCMITLIQGIRETHGLKQSTYGCCREGIVREFSAAAAKSLQSSCLTLCNPRDSSPPGSPDPGILQARTLEWVVFPSPMHESEKWKWSHSVVSKSSRPHGLKPTRFLHPWDFLDKSTGVGCRCLLQGSSLHTAILNMDNQQEPVV